MDIISKQHLYINLKKRKERKKSCINELKKIGINNPQRLEAIEHKVGLIGCARSHLKCLQIAKEKNWSHICIFEDDVIFNRYDIKELIDKYINFNYDVLYLGAWVRNNDYESINEDLIQIKYANCLHAYIVKQHYYDILIDNLTEGLRLKEKNIHIYNYFYNNDEYIRILQNKDTWLCFNPILATQENGYSDNFMKERKFKDVINTIPIKELPKISILTPTFNRRKFLELMKCNIHFFNYPKELIEWCILDSYGKDGSKSEKFLEEREVEQLSNELGIEISYVYLPQKLEIGEKRNILSQNAKHDILINMDDDDIYLPNYLTHSVHILLLNNKDCVGVLNMIYIYPENNFSLSYNVCIDISLIDESTMCMKKSHWEKSKYLDCSEGEGLNITRGFPKEIFEKTNGFHCNLCTCWDGNTVKQHKDKFKKVNSDVYKLNTPHLNVLKNIFK